MVTTASGPTVTVPRAQVAAQIQILGLPRNTLSALFEPSPGSPAAAPAYQSFEPQEQAALQLALPLLASPAMVTRTRAMLDEGHFLSTWIVTGSGNEPALTPYLLLAHDEEQDSFQMKPVANRDTVVRSFMPYLDAGLPALVGDAFELPMEAFVLLVALCDLVRRARFSAGLDHAPAPQQFTHQDIEMALADGRENPDPRWLLPHLLAIRPDLTDAPNLSRGLQALANGGWLTHGTGAVSLSEDGMRLAHALERRVAMMAFWTVGATPQGELASRSTLFVRSPWQLWCFDVGSEDGYTAVGAPVDVAAAYGLLQDLLTPVGAPLPMQEVVAAPAPTEKTSQHQTQAYPIPTSAPGVRSKASAQQAQPRQPSPLQLVVLEGSLAGQTFTLSGQTTLGRSSENTIQLEDERASRRHAQIDLQGGDWTIQDLGSRNGTFINQERIVQPVSLQTGDQVQIGDTLFQVNGPGEGRSAAAERTCPHCGQQVPVSAQFCRYCGGSLARR